MPVERAHKTDFDFAAVMVADLTPKSQQSGTRFLTISGDEKMSDKRLLDIQCKFNFIMRGSRKDAFAYLDREESAASDPDFIVKLRLFKAAELRAVDSSEEAERVLCNTTREFPGVPDSFLTLASVYLYDLENYHRALDAAFGALRAAKDDGSFVWQAVALIARCSLKTNQYNILAYALHEGSLHIPKLGATDVSPETDFLPMIPVGVVDGAVLERYTRMAGSFSKVEPDPD
jgi:hypothetical protein